MRNPSCSTWRYMKCLNVFFDFLKPVKTVSIKAASFSPLKVVSFPLLVKNMNVSTKPPNVMVYTGDNGFELYKEIENNLSRCLHHDAYVIYRATSADIVEDLWQKNTFLLVIASECIDDNIVKSLNNYFIRHGKILMFCTSFNSPIAGLQSSKESLNEELIKISYKNYYDVVVCRGKYSYIYSQDTILPEVLSIDGNRKPVMYKIAGEKSILIASEVHVEQHKFLHSIDNKGDLKFDKSKQIEVLRSILINDFGMLGCVSPVPELTPGYVIVENISFLKELKSTLKIKEIPVPYNDFSEKIQSSLSSSVTEIKLPIVFESPEKSIPFDKNAYFSHLKTNIFGHFVLFYPVITTTMYPAKYLSDYEGVVVIASCQVEGHGRHLNKWISPDGCAMFTLHFTVSVSSDLGQRLSVLQHIASLSIVHGIKKLSGYEKLDLKLKWPNDIYYGDKSKIGGVIANTTLQGNIAHIYLGCGINVANSHPTLCINDIIDNHNSLNCDCLPHLKPETVIAVALTEIEYFVQSFNKDMETFLPFYYSYWMHGKKKVKLSSLNENVTILGLDEYGFLLVATDKGQKLVLQPDGNRFDIMQNLIISKQF